MEVATLIPQLFFDLIGRVAPGLYFIVMTFLAVNHKSVADAKIQQLFFQEHSPTAIIAFALLAVSYLVGTMVGAIGYAVCNWEFPRWWSTIPPLDTRSAKYKYDYLQLKAPVAGLRLAKLSAERHACRVILCGTPIVIAAAIIWGGSSAPAISGSALFSVLAVVFFSSLCFVRHLHIRFTESVEVLYELTVSTANIPSGTESNTSA